MQKVTLLENALDYIRDAVIRLQKRDLDIMDLKYAIVHLWSGIELILKKRLMNEHWSLIFRDINKAKMDCLQTGDFVSVYYDDAVIRLKDICGVDITEYKSILTKIKEDRNRIEHFEISLSKEAAVSNLIKSWSFILDFISKNLSIDDEPDSSSIFDEIKEKILGHEDFIRHRLEDIKPILESNKNNAYPATVINCPECMQNTLFLLEEECECKFCNFKADWETTMSKWLLYHGDYRYFDLKDNMIDPVIHACPECGNEALYGFKDGSMSPPSPGWICFACGNEWEIDEIQECIRCSTMFFSSHEGDSFCGDCWPNN
jgi:hypothetical protein